MLVGDDKLLVVIQEDEARSQRLRRLLLRRVFGRSEISFKEPAPPNAITGTLTEFTILFIISKSYPLIVPSNVILFTKISLG